MADTFTEVTSKSWFSRIGQSIKSVLVGLILFVVAFPVLYWNEGRAVRTARSLKEGAGAVVSVGADRVDPANEGRLVHVSGEATTRETLTDPDLGVSANAIKLDRKVEMYQWVEEKKSEEKKKLGGGSETITTYTYRKDWSRQAIDSSSFRHPEGHQNPGSLPLESRTITAESVKLGAFTLSPPVVDRLTQTVELPVGQAEAALIPAELAGRVHVQRGKYYLGANPSSPQVGDARIAFGVVKPGPRSLVARQVSSTFEAYPAKAGSNILLVQEGIVSADAMFKAAEAANRAMTWILRVVGFILMFFGLLMVFKPIAVFGDVIPLVGTMVGAGLGIFCFLIAFGLSIVTIAVSWIFVRPLLGIGLLVLAGGAIFVLVKLGLKKKKARAALPPLPAPGAA